MKVKIVGRLKKIVKSTDIFWVYLISNDYFGGLFKCLLKNVNGLLFTVSKDMLFILKSPRD